RARRPGHSRPVLEIRANPRKARMVAARHAPQRRRAVHVTKGRKGCKDRKGALCGLRASEPCAAASAPRVVRTAVARMRVGAAPRFSPGGPATFARLRRGLRVSTLVEPLATG